MFLRNYYNALVDYACNGNTTSSNLNVYKSAACESEYTPTSATLPCGATYGIKKLMAMFPTATKASATGTAASTTHTTGVIFGTGTVEPTVDDYMMSGEHFVDYTASYTLTEEADDLGITYTCAYTLTSTASEDVTISEIGLSTTTSAKKGTASYYHFGLMVERTLLENPITIAPGGVGQITYTLRINYPTM